VSIARRISFVCAKLIKIIVGRNIFVACELICQKELWIDFGRKLLAALSKSISTENFSLG
jgi:hypothetical protein